MNFISRMEAVKHDIQEWLNENEKCFVPPICNKLMYKDGQLKTFFVGGPNSRKDFHMELGEEFFYMLKGDMNLIVVERGRFKDITIREGEVFLLPSRIPHSPQRKSDTLGLVIERERYINELDCLRYYINNSDEILYEKWFRCESLEELGPLIKEYFASEQHRTGKPIPGTILEKKPIDQDFNRALPAPFKLKTWLRENKEDLYKGCRKQLFSGNFASRVHVLGHGSYTSESDLPETFLWQLVGDSVIETADQTFHLLENQTILIPAGKVYHAQNNMEGRILSVVMNPI